MLGMLEPLSGCKAQRWKVAVREKRETEEQLCFSGPSAARLADHAGNIHPGFIRCC